MALFVRRYEGQLDGEAQILLSHIESAGARLATTAAGLRNYFRVAGADCRKTRASAEAALETALFTLQPEARECQAEISFGELPDVEADVSLLTTLFQALIQNSIKFRRAGVAPRIVVAAECSAGVCRFSITDNGIGIEPEYREQVFLAFRKLNGHTYPGAGMGLTVARTIVDVLGGKIYIAESGNSGTTVIFELSAPR